MVAPFISTSSTIYQNEKNKYYDQSHDRKIKLKVSDIQNQTSTSTNDLGDNNLSDKSGETIHVYDF